jgi:hypothetical protein
MRNVAIQGAITKFDCICAAGSKSAQKLCHAKNLMKMMMHDFSYP